MQEDDSARIQALHARLSAWAHEAMYPRWSQQGIDRAGGFVESLGTAGSLIQPRRLRVQARQIYAFAHAGELGWTTDVRAMVRRGLECLWRQYRRRDGLFRTLVHADGTALDDRALLYDQAFVLLAYAAAAALLGVAEFEAHAIELRALLARHFAAGAAFLSEPRHPEVRESNPHMHLLEACLAWCGIGSDPDWPQWARRLMQLGRRNFTHAGSGAIGESFTPDWRPSPDSVGGRVEPGHQYEWAWLFMRGEQHLSAEAARLIDNAERFGISGGFAVNALRDDLSVLEGAARLWPQTERLKATLRAARLSGETRYQALAAEAGESLFAYFNPAAPGLWFDLRGARGDIQPSAAPASTMYHLVGALRELQAMHPL